MGHMRIGMLPATEPGNGVVKKIGVEGAAAPVVADATLDAARRAFLAVGEDAGFRQTTYLLVDLALAGNQPDAAALLEKLGVNISDNTSLAEVAMQISQELDGRIGATRKRSDFGEMAQQALVGAVLEHVNGLQTRPKTLRLRGLRRATRGTVPNKILRECRCSRASRRSHSRWLRMAWRSHSYWASDKATVTVLPFTLRVQR